MVALRGNSICWVWRNCWGSVQTIAKPFTLDEMVPLVNQELSR